MAPRSDHGKSHSKPCTRCHTPRDVLVRCQIDATGTWHFVCPGACWNRVSGGVIDGDRDEEHRYYRYGGMWKNKHEAVSAKKPKAEKTGRKDEDGGTGVSGNGAEASDGGLGSIREWNGDGIRFTKNDLIKHQDRVWVCRKSHVSEGSRPPNTNISQWKEAVVYSSDAA